MAIAVSTFSSVVSRLRAVFTGPGSGPATRTASAATLAMPAANAPAWRKVAPPPSPAAQRRPDAGRLVISGRMADVCAELDRMVAQETRAPARRPGLQAAGAQRRAPAA